MAIDLCLAERALHCQLLPVKVCLVVGQGDGDSRLEEPLNTSNTINLSVADSVFIFRTLNHSEGRADW